MYLFFCISHFEFACQGHFTKENRNTIESKPNKILILFKKIGFLKKENYLFGKEKPLRGEVTHMLLLLLLSLREKFLVRFFADAGVVVVTAVVAIFTVVLVISVIYVVTATVFGADVVVFPVIDFVTTAVFDAVAVVFK